MKIWDISRVVYQLNEKEVHWDGQWAVDYEYNEEDWTKRTDVRKKEEKVVLFDVTCI